MQPDIPVRLVDRLAEVYEAQLKRYEKMLEMARHLHRLMQAGEPFDEILSERRALMEEIDACNRELASIREEIQDALGLDRFDMERVNQTVPGTSCLKLNYLLDRIKMVIREIQEQDRLSTILLQKSIQAIKVSLQELKDLRRANKAYRRELPGEGGFLDLKK